MAYEKIDDLLVVPIKPVFNPFLKTSAYSWFKILFEIKVSKNVGPRSQYQVMTTPLELDNWLKIFPLRRQHVYFQIEEVLQQQF